MPAKWLILLAAMAGSEVSFAQQSLETFYRLTGEAVTGVFEPQREVIQKCSAVIYNKRDEIAYGMVISKDGYILTKASEIQPAEEAAGGKELKIEGDSKMDIPVPNQAKAPEFTLSVRVDSQSFDEVKVIAIDKIWDLALIKVDAQDLTPAEFATDSKLEQGSWVVVNGATSRTKRRVLAGIISANAREIPTDGVVGLGLVLEIVKDKLKVKNVSEGSGAALAGVKVDDVLVTLEGKKVSEMKEVAEILKDKKVGDQVKLTVNRAGKDLDLNVELAILTTMEKPMDRNDQMSGDFSKRRSGFPRVIQHDILANSDTMGGPVLDLKGRVVGMNIARANRCETYAIPVEELQVLAKQMLENASK